MGKKKYDPEKTFKEQQTKTELPWQAKICNIINEGGGFAERIEFKLKGGCPDIIASMSYMNTTFLIECKMGKMQVDPLQRVLFKKMQLAGVDIRCICIYVDGAITWFIFFNFETGEEYARCRPNKLIETLWG
jgi:hypothetical protein